ncbi:hypothetical protein RB195_005197 [Necator americanus]|uniref:EGF-like domain-containing protein n=1 Tax=Necator americanus TaxID=51031 RepID=A0ABR1BLP1_NECAM
MDSDDDVQVVYECCNNETWKSARDRIRTQYRTVGQSTGFNHSAYSSDKSVQAGYGRSRMYREGGDALSVLSYPSCSSAMSSASSECSFTSSAATLMVPLAAKVEMIDLVTINDEDSQSVEFLQEDSDSTSSVQTVRERKKPPKLPESDELLLFSNKHESTDSDQEIGDSGEHGNISKFSEQTTIPIKEEDGVQIVTPPPTDSDVNLTTIKNVYIRSAAEVWREACRSSMSFFAVEEEKPPVFPIFASTLSTVSEASSLANDVNGMKISTESQRQRISPDSPSHDQVSSSSDAIVKKISATKTANRERELTSAWAEDHDFGLDGDEFLETEDEACGSPDINDMETEIVELTAEKSSNEKENAPRKSSYFDMTKTTGSTLKTKRKVNKTSRSKVTIDENAKRNKDNHRKRSSSSRSPQKSSSRSNAQSSKRFAVGRSRERPSQRFGYVQSSPSVCLASSAPKAKALPRYVPVERHCDFTRWFDAERELVLHKIKDVATGLVSAPLGCTYDSALDTFIFTRHDSILFATCEGRILNDLTLRGFDRPSAVSVLRPGQALGILDRSNLFLYEHHMKRLSILATGLNGRHRALTYSSSGDFVTVRKSAGQLAVTVFDSSNCDSIVASLPYPRADGVPNDQERQPCFADTVGKQIFFTDLRANTLTCIELSKDSLEKVYSRCLQQMPTHKGDETQQKFVYMSGIRCDDSGHLLVADAKTHSLKLLTSNGQFMKKVRIADGSSFPYCSSFGISPSGMLMACDRGNSRMILYRIGEETAPENAVLTDDVFDRIIGNNGVENEGFTEDIILRRMIFVVLISLSAFWTLPLGAESFFFEVHGSVVDVPENERSTSSVEAKFNVDVSSVLNRDDITLRVHELKNSFGIYISSSIFHGYVTATLNRTELISMLKTVPTIALAYVAPVESIPSLPNTSSTLSSAAVQCQGDGVPLPNNTCLCPPYSTGQYCENTNCQNYGINHGSRCACPPGFYSIYCENRGFRPAIENDLDISKRSLVIVFSLADSMQQDFQNFRANLGDMVDGMQGGDEDIATFVFLGFVLTDNNVLTYFIAHGYQLSDLDTIFDWLVFFTPAPQQPFLYEIVQAQLMYSDTRSFSNVLIFTDSGASDATFPSDLFSLNTHEQILISTANTWHNKLTFILTQTSTKPVNTSGDDYDVYRRLAEATHGDIFVIDKGEIPTVMTNVLNTYHKMENLAVRYRFNCTDMKMLTIPRELNSSETIRILLTVDKNERNPSNFDIPYVADLNNMQFSFTSRGAYYGLYNLPSGITEIRVVAATPGLLCSIRAFVTSPKAMLLSHTNNPQMDIGLPIAYKYVPQLATGLPIGFSNVTYVEIRPFDSQTVFPLSIATHGNKRISDSTYSYAFDNLSDCTPGPFIQRVDIYQGANVTTRVLPGYCALPAPPAASRREVVKSEIGVLYGQCTVMNLDAIVDPRQHAFRQIIFAIENSAAMNLAAFNLVRIIDLTVSQMNAANTELQFSLVLYDDKDIRFVSSTYDGDLFVNQFSNAMADVMSSSRTVLTSRSLDVVFKVPEISLLSPTILYLFTSSPPLPLSNYRNSLTKNLQVNVFTIRDDSDELINADLVYYQRVSGGRNLPVTVDGLLRLPPLLTSSIYENSMVTDEAAQDCSTPTTFSINYDEYASKVVVNVVGADVHLPNLVVLTTSTGYRIDVKNMFLDQNTITFSVDPQQYSIFVKPWLLAVTTTSGPCFVQVRVVSSVTVIPGFTTDSASDFPAESPFSLRGADWHAYVVFHTSYSMGSIEVVSIGAANVESPWLDSNGLQLYEVTARDNSSCTYQYYSYVEIPPSTLVKMVISGSTVGSTFRRTYYFEQTYANASTCNHGSLDVNGFGECVCFNGHTGQFCNQPICQNGGTKSMTICVCSAGFYGELCEYQVPRQWDLSTPMISTLGSTSTPQPITKVGKVVCYSLVPLTVLVSTVL